MNKKRALGCLQNKANQTQLKPNKANLKPNKTQFKPNFKPGGLRGWHCQPPACSIMSTTSLKHLTQSVLRIKLMAKIFN